MPDVARLTATYALQVAAIRARVLSFVERTWDGLGDHRDADIDRFVAAVVPVVAGGQLAVAALTDSYLAAVETEATGTTTAPVGVPASVVSDAAMRGISAVKVYHRAGVAVWTALAGGKAVAEAVAAGRDRAAAMTVLDLQLAKTHASRHVLTQKPHVAGFRRVLEGDQSCALCVIASTQRYRKEDLLPIHGHCDCSVAPIYGDNDPGRVIDAPRLASLHASVAERFGRDAVSRDARSADYRHLVAVRDHGELGPVLTVAGQTFTGPSDV